MIKKGSQARVFSFYSVKGGAGSSTTLANVGCILARTAPGVRVLLMDWDFRTPCLHEMLPLAPGPDGSPPTDAPGLIELLRDLSTSIPEVVDDPDHLVDIVFEDIDLTKYARSVLLEGLAGDGGVSLIPAGRFDSRYSGRFGEFRWSKLEKKAPWIWCELAERLAAEWDYVLVDCPPGMSDASRVATALLPGTLVVSVSPDELTLSNTVGAIREALAQRADSACEAPPLRVLPVPSRLVQKRALLQRWRRGDRESEGGFPGYQKTFEELFADVESMEIDLETYFDDILVPNIPGLGLEGGGKLSTRSGAESSHTSLLAAYLRLAVAIQRGVPPWEWESVTPPRMSRRGRETEGSEERPAEDAEDGVVYEIVTLAPESEGATEDAPPRSTPTPRPTPAKDSTSSTVEAAVAPARRAEPAPESGQQRIAIVVLLLVAAAVALLAVVIFQGDGDRRAEATDARRAPRGAATAPLAGDADPGDGGHAGDAATSDDRPACEPGRVRHAETAGHCCWPGQIWSAERGACVGERCPPTMIEDETGCQCRPGRVVADDDGVHCCWPGQTWSAVQARCLGDARCPRGWLARGDGCVDPGAPGQWVVIEPGTFRMGSPESEIGREAGETLHDVTLTRPFLISATEVTQAQYRAVTNANPSRHEGCDRCPVENVTWHEAAAYANALSRRAELDLCYTCEDHGGEPRCALRDGLASPYDCPGFRLPTEAEWEYAARAGADSATGRGELDRARLVCEGQQAALDPVAWYCGNSESSQEVGSLAANAWGLYDMLGNVTEWCHDLHGRLGRDAVTDPVGATGRQRVCRGGSYGSYARETRLARRFSWRPEARSEYIGFRLARTITP